MNKIGKIIFAFLILFVAFGVLSFFPPLKAVVESARTISTREKGITEKIFDTVIVLPGDVISFGTNSVSSLFSKASSGDFKSEEKQAADDFLEFKNKQKEGAASSFKFTNKNTNVKGVSTIQGSVLAGESSAYVQYLPIPGAGNYSSSAFTGSSSINIPLNLPKGFGGYTPSLSFNYSSSAVDSFKSGEDAQRMFLFTRQSGELGFGWSIGESSISIDNHGEQDPCFWTWKIQFPGGQGEMFKVDSEGNKIKKCEYKKIGKGKTAEFEWVATSAWEKSSEWRTTPEMFLKIRSGLAKDLFPGENIFKNETSVWRIQTPDGSTYAFGSGRERTARDGTIMFHNEPWDAVRTDPKDSKKIIGYSRHCNTKITSWKLFQSKNIFNEKIRYTYQAADASGSCNNFNGGQPITPVASSRLMRIDYGASSVRLSYDQTRKDIKLVRDDGENYVYYTKKDQFKVDDKALSQVSVFANNNFVRKYKVSYYDTWQTAPANETFNKNCPKGKFRYNTGGGYYVLNDNVKSFHLMLKSVEEETSSGKSLPKQIFTYASIPYYVNNVNCQPNLSVQDDKNSIYLKTASNGFGGTTEYFFDSQRLSDRVYESNGKTYLANGIGVKNNERGSKRARLSKIRVSDGIGNFSESVMQYSSNEPLIVYTPDVVGRKDGDMIDNDFLGYSAVTTYAGKKNLNLTDVGDPREWLSKSKTNFFQMLTSAGCVRKDPRSGMPGTSQQFDDVGVIAESTSVVAFKNISGNELCTQIPDRPLILNLESQSIKANRGVSLPTGITMTSMCASSNPPSYCNFISLSKNTYDWNFGLINNPEKGKFAALKKSESFIKKLLPNKTYMTKLVASSETNYVSQGYTDNKTYLLNKPYELWINNVDDLTDKQKYKWQKTYFDSLGNGVLNANGKNLVSKSESLLANGNVVGVSEVMSYDSWGNVLKTRDGNGNVSQVAYDNVFHVYPVSATNAKGQTVSTVYDFQGNYSTKIGLPISVTDINGLTTRSEYDGLGRLTKMFKPGDALPSLEFEYSFVNENQNQMASFNAPIVTLAKVRTEKDTTDDAKILKTYDLYDGLGNKIQSQSLVAGKVMTSWQDQDGATPNMIGMKTFSTESFVSDKPFGFFNKNYPAGTKISYSETNLSGNYSKSTDIVGNNSFSFSNSEILSSKTLSPNGIYSLSFSDPIERVSTSILCKDKGSVDQNVFDCPTGNQIQSKAYADFMGATIKTINNNNAVIGKSTHDSLGRAISSWDHDLGESMIIAYDRNGNVVKTKDAAGVIFEINYDELNRPVVKKINGTKRTEFVYDHSNDENKDCGSSPQGKLCEKFEYGNNPLDLSNLTRIDKFYKYDSFGRLIENRVNYGGILDEWFGKTDFATEMQYDNIDRMTSVKYPEFIGSGIPAEMVKYTYNGPYLKTVAGDKTYVSDLIYDERGRLVTRKLGNNVNENYGYDDAGTRALNNILVAKPPTGLSPVSPIVNLNYTYDNQTGNILKTQDGNTTKTYEYDNLSRLTRALIGDKTETFEYDDLNSMTRKEENGKNIFFATNYNVDENVRPYHGVNQIKSDDGVGDAKYDVLGRMTSYEIPGDKTITVSSFDLGSGKPEKITYASLAVFSTPSATIAPVVSATPSATIAPVATQSAGIIIALKPGVNQNLKTSFFETAKDVANAVKAQCKATTGTYLTFVENGVRKTFVMDYTTQNFDIQASLNFDINLVATSDCNLNLEPIRVEPSVQGAETPLTEVYFYDGEGNRVMKGIINSTGKLTAPVLYASSYLERDFGANIIRKNYFADEKLVATRVFDLNLTPIPLPTTPVTTITMAPCPSGQSVPHFEVNRFGVCTSIETCGISAPQCSVAH